MREQNESVPTAITISGNTRGAFAKPRNKALTLLLSLWPIPIAIPDAIAVAIIAAGIAKTRDVWAAFRRSLLLKIVAYHLIENPFQTMASSDSLNDNSKTLNRGR